MNRGRNQALQRPDGRVVFDQPHGNLPSTISNENPRGDNALFVEWLKRIFDAKIFPCFKEEFIHPNALVPLMADAARTMGLRGCAAPLPFRVE